VDDEEIERRRNVSQLCALPSYDGAGERYFNQVPASFARSNSR